MDFKLHGITDPRWGMRHLLAYFYANRDKRNLCENKPAKTAEIIGVPASKIHEWQVSLAEHGFIVIKKHNIRLLVNDLPISVKDESVFSLPQPIDVPRPAVKLSRTVGTFLRGIERASKLGLPDTLTIDEWQSCLQYWDNRCAYCGTKCEHVAIAEHFIPLSHSRTLGTVAGNILPSCDVCNNSKNNNSPYEWIIRRFGGEHGKSIIVAILAYFDTIETA